MAFKYSKRVKSSKWTSNTEVNVASKRRRKIDYFINRPAPDSVVQNTDIHGLTHLFRADNTNCGDWWSLPARYFTFPDHDHVIDISDYEEGTKLFGTVIVGGGGLIGPAFKQLESLITQPDVKSIAWGVGNNMVDDKSSRYVSYAPDLPSYVEEFDLFSIRDDISGYRWVPCASCMHPLFSKHYTIEHDIVIYEHKRLPLDIPGIPKMSNDGADIESVIQFLASAETVITNSYHGAYWATLLNRKCIAIPFSSKFHAFRHKVTLCREDEWRSKLSEAQNHPEALSECRKANISFYHDSMDLILS